MTRPRVWTPQWRQAFASGEASGFVLCKQAGDLEFVKKGDGDEGSFQFIISSETKDRYGDVIKLDGWSTDNFFRAKGRGPVLWAHRSDEPQFVLGTSPSVSVDGDKLIGAVDFYPEEINVNSTRVAAMAKLGGMSASVGFDPLEMEYDEDADGYVFLAQDLLEFSVVPVPANPEAVPKAMAAGLDLSWMDDWARRTLDELHGGNMLVLHKDKLEAVVKALGYGRGLKFFDLGAGEIRKQVKAKLSGESKGYPIEVAVDASALEPLSSAIKEVSDYLEEQNEVMQGLRTEIDQLRADVVASEEREAKARETVNEFVLDFDASETEPEPESLFGFAAAIEDDEPEELVRLDFDDLRDEIRELIREAETDRSNAITGLKQEITQLTGRVL